MQATTKERFTGALILIAVLVILVPEMLSGPDAGQSGDVPPAQSPEAGAPLRTYELALESGAAPRPAPQGAVEPAAETRAAASPLPVTEPPPSEVASPVEPAPAAQSRPVEQDKPAIAEKPAPEDSKPAQTAQTSRETRPTEQSKPAAEKPAVESASAKQVAPVAKGWWVQLGSFASRDNADRLARQLRTSGFPLEVSRIRAQGKELYRVRAGPVKDRAAAVALQARLAAAGHKSSLVAP